MTEMSIFGNRITSVFELLGTRVAPVVRKEIAARAG